MRRDFMARFRRSIFRVLPWPLTVNSMNEHRLLLTRTLKVLTLIGVGFAAYPFITALLPDSGVGSDRQRQWLREIDLSGLRPGELLEIDDWPGGPVAVYRRSAHEIAGLGRIEAQLHDPWSQHSRQPEDMRTATRSLLPDYFVFIPAETGRGCHLRYTAPDRQPRPDIVWYGGFVDLCTGSLYDTAGRVYARYRTERHRNLTVPPYGNGPAQRIRLEHMNR
jgi:ubiquinol-cytochrome c reductase iron-sulfur subunit